MGLDTSHDCWHGAYSAFMRWRTKLCEVAGYGDYMDYFTPEARSFRDDGRGPAKPIPNDDPLWSLLAHSDCDGEIATADCAPLADALEKLLPALKNAGDGGGHIGDYETKTRQFITGLRAAASAGESVDFH